MVSTISHDGWRRGGGPISLSVSSGAGSGSALPSSGTTRHPTRVGWSCISLDAGVARQRRPVDAEADVGPPETAGHHGRKGMEQLVHHDAPDEHRPDQQCDGQPRQAGRGEACSGRSWRRSDECAARPARCDGSVMWSAPDRAAGQAWARFRYLRIHQPERRAPRRAEREGGALVDAAMRGATARPRARSGRGVRRGRLRRRRARAGASSRASGAVRRRASREGESRCSRGPRRRSRAPGDPR